MWFSVYRPSVIESQLSPPSLLASSPPTSTDAYMSDGSDGSTAIPMTRFASGCM